MKRDSCLCQLVPNEAREWGVRNQNPQAPTGWYLMGNLSGEVGDIVLWSPGRERFCWSWIQGCFVFHHQLEFPGHLFAETTVGFCLNLVGLLLPHSDFASWWQFILVLTVALEFSCIVVRETKFVINFLFNPLAITSSIISKPSGVKSV